MDGEDNHNFEVGGGVGAQSQSTEGARSNQSANLSVTGGINPFLKLLKVNVVADELVRYLSFNDLQALTLVSRDCLTAIRNTRTFANNTSYRICMDDGEESEKILKGNTFLWKHVSLDISKVPVKSLGLLADILKSADSISISIGRRGTSREAARYLREILKKTTKLRELELGFGVLLKNVKNVLTKFESLIDLNKLKSIVISQRGCFRTNQGNKFLIQNLAQLSLLPFRLKKFVFSWGRFPSSCYRDVPSIVQASQDTLEYLELHNDVWKQEKMKTIRCPKLKRLVMSASEFQQEFGEVMDTFMMNQPPLEELTIELNKFPAALLLSLQPRLRNMRKFHISTECFVGSSEPVDWTFLGTMTKLKTFYIRKPYLMDNLNIYGWGEDIVRQLPLSTARISVLEMCPFWRENNDELRGHGPNIGTLLSRFGNLTALDLCGSLGAVNDAGLQTLIQTCPKLTRLTFSDCSDLTDFGISGIRNSEEEGGSQENCGASLTNLKGLTHLEILRCPNISPDCILNVVKFDHLRFFDFEYCDRFWNHLPKAFFSQIVRQNRCLEIIGSEMTDGYPGYLQSTLEKEMKELNPRIQLEKRGW